MPRNEKELFLACVFVCACLNIEISAATQRCCPPNSSLVQESFICSDKTLVKLNCKNGKHILDPKISEHDKFFVDTGGFLIVDGGSIPENEFCLTEIIRNGSTVGSDTVALVCFKDESDFLSIVLKILMLISIIFLILTLYVYLAVAKLRDLQGKCLIAFISCLTTSYITLLVVQTFTETSLKVCIIQGAVLYFFFTASFFWNNIINFNIWFKVRYASRKLEDKPLYIVYMCCWGFGVPILMVILSFVLEYVPGGNHVRPGFGEVCFFGNNLSTWVYFYGPISILIVLNIFMFIHTFWMLSKTFWKPSSSKKKSLRFKFAMYLKLFIIMGVTWSFEVISFATKDYSSSKYIWVLTDCLNSGQGIIIFLILVVFRQKVKLGLLENKVCGIPWPQSWANEKIQESSTLSAVDEVELGGPKEKMISKS